MFAVTYSFFCFNKHCIARNVGKIKFLIFTMANRNKSKIAPIKNSPNLHCEDIYEDKNGNIMMKILAKPGSKQNQVTDITEEGIGVKISAPPVEGEANKELIKYFAKVLNVPKSALSLDKGSKSKSKTLQLNVGISSVQEVRDKLNKEMDS